MWIRHAIALVALFGTLSSARAEDFRIEDVGSPPNWDVAALKPGTIAFSDGAVSASAAANLIAFTEWGRTLPAQKKFLSLYPAYSEPTITKTASVEAPAGPVLEKLDMYVAQARFIADRDTLVDGQKRQTADMRRQYFRRAALHGGFRSAQPTLHFVTPPRAAPARRGRRPWRCRLAAHRHGRCRGI